MNDPLSSLGKAMINLGGNVIGGVGNTVTEVSKTVVGVGGAVVGISSKLVGVVSEDLIYNTLELLNPKDIIIFFGRKYILNMLLEEKKRSLHEQIIDNLNFSITQFFLTPFERSRQLLQTQHLFRNLKSPYLGTFDSFFKILRDTGFKSLFRGGVPGLFYNIYYFNVNDYKQKTLIKSFNKDKSNKQTLHTFLNLFLFDLTHNFITYPLDLIWTRRSCDTTKKVEHRFFMKELHYLLTSKGISSIFIGYSYSLSFYISYYSLLIPYVLNYSFKRRDLLDIYFELTVSLVTLEFLLFPFDTLRRRKIIQRHESVGIEKYTDFKQTVRTIYKEEHIAGFYRGCFLKFSLLMIRRMLFFLTYNYTSSYTPNLTEKNV